MILHLDGDAFFVSVEAAMDPSLRGKPVVTGAERGIASALSYEAKKLGITRAMPIFQIRREFPQVIVVDSDYRSYAVFSKRMMDIVRRYTDSVEEYSIDECFAYFADSDPRMADPQATLSRIQRDIRRELGIGVSLGLGRTKVIAKTASKSRKPYGVAIAREEDVSALLDATPVEKVWGIGSATAFELRKKGVRTALELARKPGEWVEEHFSKPMVEMWHELNGRSVHQVDGSEGDAQKSIMKTRTFVPASKDRARVFSELSKNIENACRKARELGLVASGLSIYLKSRDLSYAGESCRFIIPTNDPFDALEEARKMFETVFDPVVLYRATGATLSGLMPVFARQDDLFGSVRSANESSRVFEAVDRLNRRYGRPIIRIASSHDAYAREEKDDGRSRKRLALPFLGDAS